MLALVGLLAAAMLLFGCGVPASQTAQEATAASPLATTYPEPITRPWPIARVRRGPEPTSVMVDVAAIPADTTGPCAATVSTEVNEQPLVVGIGVDVASRREPPSFGCTPSTRTLVVHLRQPLGTRDVVASGAVTPQGGRFVAHGEGYQQCIPTACDPQLVRLPADCANLRASILKTDVPLHSGVAGPCREPYAAVVVDIGEGACPAQDEGPHICAGKRSTNQFWYSDGTTWRLLVNQRGATCEDARKIRQSFPVALCQDPAWRSATVS